jgi:membrane glycosyltransferase
LLRNAAFAFFNDAIYRPVARKLTSFYYSVMQLYIHRSEFVLSDTVMREIAVAEKKRVNDLCVQAFGVLSAFFL